MPIGVEGRRERPLLRPAAACGERRKVDRLATVRFASARYSVQHRLVGATVESRGTFALSDGSLVVGLMQVGNATSNGVGTFVQSGGAARIITGNNIYSEAD